MRGKRKKTKKTISCFNFRAQGSECFSMIVYVLVYPGRKVVTNFRPSPKFWTFWEAHIIWKKKSSWFWCLLSKSADLSKDFFKFCVSQKVRTLSQQCYCSQILRKQVPNSHTWKNFSHSKSRQLSKHNSTPNWH